MNAVRRKIDWRIMPLAAWTCGLQFVDKVCAALMPGGHHSNDRYQSALGAAATYGLREDLDLHGQEYSWCVSVCMPNLSW